MPFACFSQRCGGVGRKRRDINFADFHLGIGILVEKKILMAVDCMQWVEEALIACGNRLAAITPRIAIQSTRLPGEVHGDPADRILLATAHEESAVLVTCDQKLLDYGKGRFVSVYNPS